MANPIKENAIKILIALFENNPNEERKFDGNDIANYTKLSPNEINNAIEYLDEQGFLNRKYKSNTLPFKFSRVHLNSKGNYYYHEIKNDQETEGAKETKIYKKTMDIFISHSHTDVEIAKALIELLRTSLNFKTSDIRCTSVDGFRLPAGISTDEQLRTEIYDAKVLIGLISPASVSSYYVLFELGARWGAKKPLIPLVTNVQGTELLKGPLQGINALYAYKEPQLFQLITELGNELDIRPESPESYQHHLKKLAQLCSEVSTEQKDDNNWLSISDYSNADEKLRNIVKKNGLKIFICK